MIEIKEFRIPTENTNKYITLLQEFTTHKNNGITLSRQLEIPDDKYILL